MKTDENHVYYTARHLLEALSKMDESLLDLPLMLLHGKELTKPNLVSGLIPSPIDVPREVVEEKKPSLLTFAALISISAEACGIQRQLPCRGLE